MLGTQLRQDVVSSDEKWLTDRLTGDDIGMAQYGVYAQTETRLLPQLQLLLAGPLRQPRPVRAAVLPQGPRTWINARNLGQKNLERRGALAGQVYGSVAPLFGVVRELGFAHSFFGRIFNYLDEVLGIKAWASVFGFCLILSFLIFWDVDVNHQVYLGEVATTEVKSPISFTMTDEVATEEKRPAAEAAIHRFSILIPIPMSC